ncbi:MAG: hypothetical protein ACPGYX_02255 [Oceanobacter sp.]
MRFFKLLLGLTLITTATSVMADPPYRYRHAEHHILPQWLITFSSEGVTAKLCEDCSITTWKSVGHTEWKEYTENVDLQRATELYVSKHQFEVIYLGLDQQEGRLDYIDFGGFPGEN